MAVAAMATMVFGTGLLLGAREGGHRYGRYTEYGLIDWLLLLLPIVVALRLIPQLVKGPDAIMRDIAAWTYQPWRIWNEAVVWGLLVIFLAWHFAQRVAADLRELCAQPAEGVAAGGRQHLVWSARFTDHDAAYNAYVRKVLIGGLVLLLMAGVATASVSRTHEHRAQELPPLELSTAPLVLYWFLALVSANQASLARLRAGWIRSGAAVQAGLAHRWFGYGFGLMALALGGAALLPTSYTEAAAAGLPRLLQWLWIGQWPVRFTLGAAFDVIGYLGWIVLGPFVSLFVWLLPQPQRTQRGFPLVERTMRTPTPEETDFVVRPAIDWSAVGAGLIYVLAGAVVAGAVWLVWQRRVTLVRLLHTTGAAAIGLIRLGLTRLAALIGWLFAVIAPDGYVSPLTGGRWWEGRQRTGAYAPGAAWWLRLRGLTPRELILYYYLSIAYRAAKVGWQRRKGQTPYEYSRELSQHLGDYRQEIEELTQAFVRAKYSAHAVTAHDLHIVRRPWERLRGTLQNRWRAHRLKKWTGYGGG